jgi:hypothetical protein
MIVYFVSSSQSFFRINWEKTYDINQRDKINTVLKTTDGNYLLGGETTSASVPGQKILIVKMNPNGDLIWYKTYGSDAEFGFKSITKAGADGYYILGTKQPGTATSRIYVVKIDKDGNTLWETTTGGGGIEIINDLFESAENGVYLIGAKEIKGNNDTEGWLIKLNKKGVVESQSMFGARYINDGFNTITADKAGGYYLAGFTSEKLGGEKIPYILHLDPKGYKIWEKSYSEFQGAIPSSLYINSDGLIVCLMGVYTKTGDFVNITKMMIDPAGALINSFTTPHRLNITKNSFAISENDQLMLLSEQNPDPAVISDKYIIRLNQSLSPIWIKPVEMEYVTLNSIHAVDNSNYISVGWTGLNNYKLDLKVFSFRDYSEKLIESYVNQNLIAIAGMNVNETQKDFRARIGNPQYETLVSRYESEAIANLRLIPEAYASNSMERSESRPAPITPPRENKVTNADIALNGKYYALLIAVEDYNDPMINDLDKPVKDAQKLFDVLINEYLFEKTNVTFLKNPTREQIISSLDRLEKELTKSDNLLIFYAGHGYWNETSQKGFWLPSDASKQNTANWIGNSSVSDYIRSIPAKHTLLIADACFSGSIFKTRAAFGNQDLSSMKLYELTSRKAMTSGTLTEVPDKSVFIDFLVKRLYENQENYLPSEQLFFSFKPAVLNNTESIPQFGVVGNAGDEGGDFIFVKRKK